MVPNELSALKSLAANLGAILAVTDSELKEVKFATTRLTSITKSSCGAYSENGSGRQSDTSQNVEMEVVSICMKGRKRPVDAIKFSRRIPSRKERICVFFEIHNLQSGYKSLRQLMPVMNGSPDMLEQFLSLSHRERQVAGMVGGGLTSREIAGKLHISENTVKNHRKRLKKRLSFKDAREYKGFLKWASLQENAGRHLST